MYWFYRIRLEIHLGLDILTEVKIRNRVPPDRHPRVNGTGAQYKRKNPYRPINSLSE